MRKLLTRLSESLKRPTGELTADVKNAVSTELVLQERAVRELEERLRDRLHMHNPVPR